MTRALAAALLALTTVRCAQKPTKAVIQVVPDFTEAQARRMVANLEIDVSVYDENGRCDGGHAVGSPADGLRALPGGAGGDMRFEVSPGTRVIGLAVHGLDGGVMFEGCRRQRIDPGAPQNVELTMVADHSAAPGE